MDVSFLYATLDETPKELTKLYYNILTRSLEYMTPNEIHTMIRVLQWILFSARPLTLEEWHHVFAFIDMPWLESIQQWKISQIYRENDHLLLQRIQRVCIGFVDVKDRQMPFRPLGVHSEASSLGAGAGSFESHQHIGVIHSSIREFLLEADGFALLNQEIKNPIGEGHAYILEVCIRYCFLEEMKIAFSFEQREERKKTYRPYITNQKSPATINDEIHETSETMSLGSSAGSSIRSLRIGDRPRGDAASMTIPKSASNAEFGEDEAGLGTKVVSDYLDTLEFPNQDTLSKTPAWMDSNTSVGTTGSCLEHLEVVKEPPSLWQYCQNMLVYHAVATEKACIIPKSALDFLFSRGPQDIEAWAATRTDMQHGATLKYFAAQWNLASWLRFLGPRWYPNQPGGQLSYPIIIAAKNDNIETFRYLATEKRPLDIFYFDSQRRTALHHAAMYPDSSVLLFIRELLDLQPNDFKTAVACLADKEDKGGWAALHRAAFYGTKKNVQQLLSMGARVNIQDREGNTPLHLSCLRKDPDLAVCKTLVEAGCDHHMRNLDHKTGLQIAQECGHSLLINYLTGAPPPGKKPLLTPVQRRLRRSSSLGSAKSQRVQRAAVLTVLY
jgi:ankyrin repeat protein